VVAGSKVVNCGSRLIARIARGCGDIDDPRFINVDARAFPHVHLVSRSAMLAEFGEASADLLYACHVFEHFSFLRQRSILKRWHAVLKPGGRIMLSVPDFDKIVAIFVESGRRTTCIQEMLMGAQDYPGNFHYAIFTKRHLTGLLEEAGFGDIEEWHPRDERDWPRDWSWDDKVSLNLSARKSTR
jgi:predicted SAM-dependent methyltransferase